MNPPLRDACDVGYQPASPNSPPPGPRLGLEPATLSPWALQPAGGSSALRRRHRSDADAAMPNPGETGNTKHWHRSPHSKRRPSPHEAPSLPTCMIFADAYSSQSLLSTEYTYKDLTLVPAFYAKLCASSLLLIFRPLPSKGLYCHRRRVRASPCHLTRRNQSTTSVYPLLQIGFTIQTSSLHAFLNRTPVLSCRTSEPAGWALAEDAYCHERDYRT
ncbi:hypothetical protein LZ31DRAFT_356524 [Colletotrichum somersetense]|nr:hypothetical protein LZ31DRAFT_356524 [Colletotrichum somersetense]